MTMHEISSFGRQQATTPAFWQDYEAFPFTSLRRDMDRFFENFVRKPVFGFGAYSPASGVTATWPIVEVKDLETKLMVSAEIPGVAPKDVELLFDRGVLTIRGEKKGEKDEAGYSELFYGKFERQIPLPYSVDLEHCHAEFRDGLLSIELPKFAEVENKKKIPIKVETRH